MNIQPHEIRIDYFRKKGQSNWINLAPIGVRITHIPTKIFVDVESERSQHANRHKAFELLQQSLNEFYIMSENKS